MFFEVHLVHLLTAAALFVMALQNIIAHWLLPVPLTGDYILVGATGLGLALLGWKFYVQKP
ncbi:MAG TPA: hypothetical protein VGH23_22115 [Rhizomicrobium sp.]